MELTKNINGNMGINEEQIILRERLACTQEMHVSFSERRSYLKGLTIAIYIIYHIYQISDMWQQKSYSSEHFYRTYFPGFLLLCQVFCFFLFSFIFIFIYFTNAIIGFFLHWIGVQANKTKLVTKRSQGSKDPLLPSSQRS